MYNFIYIIYTKSYLYFYKFIDNNNYYLYIYILIYIYAFISFRFGRVRNRSPHRASLQGVLVGPASEWGTAGNAVTIPGESIPQGDLPIMIDLQFWECVWD